MPAGTLLHYLKSCVNKEAFSDVTVILDGNRKIRAHKLLLMRTPYFQAMFGSEMKESKTNTVALENVPYDAFLLVLQYLYTDECDVPLNSAMELFEVADRFGIDRLKLMCEQTIIANINIANATLIFQVSAIVRKIGG